MDLQRLKALVAEGKYEFSKHAERERELDMISVEELEDAISGCELIEDYPDDPRGPSCLLLGFCKQRPIHVVCTIKTDPEEVLLITLYDPSKRTEKWTEDYKERR